MMSRARDQKGGLPKERTALGFNHKDIFLHAEIIINI